jgi:hypothetical protein
MEALKQTQKKYATRALTFAIIAALFFILMGEKSIGKGLVLGTVFSVLNFILMGQSIAWKLGHSKRKTFSIALGSIFFRYILLAIPLIVAVRSTQFHLVSAALGIFMIQLVILADHFRTFIPFTRRKHI